jgi:glycosyltransferase involved in cell wall biosynthesis
MRAGLPVVASAVGGVDEAIRDGDNGFLVPRGDLEVLRSRLERLLTDASLRVQMGRRGRARFENEFTLDRTVSRTLDVYQGVVSRWTHHEAGPAGSR